MREPRNQIIDVARVAAVVMVVVFHSTLFRMDLTPQGPVAHPWEPGPWWWPWSWLAMSLPLFFVASGYVAAIAVDRLEPGLEGYARYVIHRSLRLVGPLVLFVTVVVGAATWAAWQVGEPPPTLYPGPDRDSWLDAAASVSKDSLFFLWFVAIWLALLSIAPLMVWAHDRGGAVPVVVLGLAAAALDRWSFLAHDQSVRELNYLIVWGACHQLGIAYQRGWLRRGPDHAPWVVLGAGVATLGLAVGVLGYPASPLAFADPGVANNRPPTAALVVLGLVQVAVLALIERTAPPRLPEPVDRAVRWLNTLTVDVYLWHTACILIAVQALLWAALAVPGHAEVLVHPAMVSTASLGVVLLLVPWFSRLGRLLTPKQTGPADVATAMVGVALLTAGTALVWTQGGVLHPARPWSSLGVIALWVGAALIAVAARDGQAKSNPGR